MSFYSPRILMAAPLAGLAFLLGACGEAVVPPAVVAAVPAASAEPATPAPVPAGSGDGLLAGYVEEVRGEAGELLREAHFEPGAKAAWQLGPGLAMREAGGRSMTGVLLAERDASTAYGVARQTLRLRPGTRYTMSAWVKTEGVQGPDTGAAITMEFTRRGEYLGGAYPPGIKGDSDWVLLQENFTTPEGEFDASFALYLRKGMQGRAWFDDASVREQGADWRIYPLSPKFNRLSAGNAEILLGSRVVGVSGAESLECHVSYVDAGGVRRESFLPIVADRVVFTPERPPADGLVATFSLVRREGRILYARRQHEFTVAAPKESAGAGAVTVERDGRLRRDGKAILPLGLYLSNFHDADLERIRAAGFNCVLPYAGKHLSLQAGPARSADEPRRVREAMDRAAEQGLDVVFSIKDFYPGTTWAESTWAGVSGTDASVAGIVEAFRDHPALLAWYISDEKPLSRVGEIEARRALVNRLDPAHPTLTVYYQYEDLPGYGAGSDMWGVDPYPVRGPGAAKQEEVRHAWQRARAAFHTGTGLAVWAVVQAHNLGNYDPDAKVNAADYEQRFRDPTEEEMRSMALLQAMYGARAFLFYSYFDLFNGPGAARGEARWASLRGAVASLKELESGILAGPEPAPAALEVIEGEVEARRWRLADGRAAIALASIGPGASRARFRPPGEERFRSLHGRVRTAEDGSLEFTGSGISSDVLLQEIPSPSPSP